MATYEEMAYGPLGEAVTEAMVTSEADPIGVWAACLSMYSGAISRTVRLDNRRPVVVWTVLAGRSAIGRKGYALYTATSILSKVTGLGGFIHTRRRSGVSSGPSLVDMLSQLELDSVGQEGGIDGRAILIEEEWAAVLKTQKRCPKFSTLFRTAWDGKPISNRTKKDGLQSVAQPLLGFHAHITPGEWAKYVSSSEALGGSYNRLLPVIVERSKLLPWDNKPVIPDVSAIQEAFDWVTEENRVMRFSKDAGARYDEIRAEVEAKMAELPELLASYMERSAEQVQRVAAVLASTEMTEEVSTEAVEAAWAFVSHSMDSVEKLVKEAASEAGSTKAEKSPEEMIRDVLNRYGGEAKASDLLRALWGKLNAAGMKAAVDEMDDVEVVQEKTGKRGAPRTVYRLVSVENQGERPEKPELKVISIEALRSQPEPVPVTNTNPFMALL
ncbi:DUF3987 domain-containing protein [Streptomyces sp. NPDC001118]|uniref:DUF3987 domain-containing protein n=1 Tax=Streptomyces sp. NPDC001127 TaxID=3154377 RepID=UPI003319F10B